MTGKRRLALFAMIRPMYTIFDSLVYVLLLRMANEGTRRVTETDIH